MTERVLQAPVPAHRTDLQVLQDQLDGMRAWHESLRTTEDTGQRVAETREARLDARRRLDALKRAQRALLERSDSTMRASIDILAARPARAVIVHRNEWMRTKLAVSFTDTGLAVLGGYDDGADGLGTAIAEQPELLVVEDRLPSITGFELVRSACRFLPHTTVVAQVESSDSVGAMLDAGARAVFSRRVPPATIAEQVADFLRDEAAEPLLLL